METTVVRVRIEGETKAELERFAARTERSVSGAIRLAIQRLLASEKEGAPE